MAWLQKRGGVYWVGWRHGGREFRQSTKQSDRSKAQVMLEKIIALESARGFDSLTAEFYAAVTGRKVERLTAARFFEDWLKESEPVTTASTMNKYRQVVREFSEHIEAEAKGIMLEDVTVQQVSGFLALKGQQLAAGTVKGYRRILSSIFLQAQNRGVIKANPVALAKSRGRPETDSSLKKRPFTLTELQALHTKATSFWRWMITAGYYTGQNLGDLITLRAENVDLTRNQITLNRRKTGKQVLIPTALRLRDALVEIWPKTGTGFLWPDQAAKYLKTGPSSFSQEFYDLLASAGLVRPRAGGKQAAGKGRSIKREAQKLGFHNLRHTFVTHLKIGGAMDSVARELAGHSSNAVSSVYTHLPAETLSNAIAQLPEIPPTPSPQQDSQEKLQG